MQRKVWAELSIVGGTQHWISIEKRVCGTKSLISNGTNSRQLPPTMEIVLEMKIQKFPVNR